MRSKSGGRQITIYDAQIREEMRREAARFERSLCWIAQQAWRLAREEVRAIAVPAGAADAHGEEV